MPVIIYKEKFKKDELSIAFNCEHIKGLGLKLKNSDAIEFDSSEYEKRIKNIVKDLSEDILNNYLKKYHNNQTVAVAEYVLDSIPTIFSIKFVSKSSESIYYAEELKMIKESLKE